MIIGPDPHPPLAFALGPVFGTLKLVPSVSVMLGGHVIASGANVAGTVVECCVVVPAVIIVTVLPPVIVVVVVVVCTDDSMVGGIYRASGDANVRERVIPTMSTAKRIKHPKTNETLYQLIR